MIAGHDKRGRFTSGAGNKGRPKGSRNKPPRSGNRQLERADHPVLLRFHELLSRIVDDLGGPDALSTGQEQLARRCAWMSTQCEIIEKKETETLQSIDYAKYTNMAGHLVRSFRSLGLERQPRTLVLQDYLSAVQQQSSQELVTADGTQQSAQFDDDEDDLVPISENRLNPPELDELDPPPSSPDPLPDTVENGDGHRSSAIGDDAPED
jgi:hypothetical protein